MSMKVWSRFFEEGYSAMRFILMITGIICILMSLTSTPEYFYGVTNAAEGILAMTIAGVTFTKWGKRNYLHLGTSYIIILDFLNLVPVTASQYLDKYSYQYLIFFFVSSIFCSDRRSLLLTVFLNVVALIVLSGLPSANSSSIVDFYFSCLLCFGTLTVLMLYRFHVEIKLAQSEKQYRLITENSADIICTHTMDGSIEFASPSLAILTGYTPEELHGKSPFDFVHPDDRKRLDAFNELKSGQDRFFQYRFRKKNGAYIWLETLVKGITPDQEGLGEGHFLSQTRSFQKNHQYQEEIERKNQELKSSYNDMEMFAYIASHDMQEPLRMISSYMQLLKRRYATAADPESIEFIEYALRGASNLQALTRDLLAYSTLNKKDLTITKVDLQELLDDITNDLKMLLVERNAILEIPERFPMYYCDKNAIRQLLQNLIQNGIKYNTSEQPVITITHQVVGKGMLFSLRDNGIGIEMQYAQTIFEPFKRLHTKNQYAGTGLGLSICKRIIDRHGGNIWVESVVGEGSSFFFTIPSAERLQSLQNNVNGVNL
ncbi:MAG: ATP-binding protein [Chitinophagales bacterium]